MTSLCFKLFKFLVKLLFRASQSLCRGSKLFDLGEHLRKIVYKSICEQSSSSSASAHWTLAVWKSIQFIGNDEPLKNRWMDQKLISQSCLCETVYTHQTLFISLMQGVLFAYAAGSAAWWNMSMSSVVRLFSDADHFLWRLSEPWTS